MYGICNLSIAALRGEPSHRAEMTNQILFGEHFQILEKNTSWSKIKLAYDGFEAYIDNKQFTEITQETFEKITTTTSTFAGELIDFFSDQQHFLTTIPLGAILPFYKDKSFSINQEVYQYEGKISRGISSKQSLVEVAFLFLNTPYLWGGKTPFGIDADGFTQMVYKLCGYQLARSAQQQASQGEVLSFIEESEPGDLAFFDNEDGEIIHVGIVMSDYNIIHCYGKVRIDKLDHSGIYNTDTQKHTHRLRMIKKLI